MSLPRESLDLAWVGSALGLWNRRLDLDIMLGAGLCPETAVRTLLRPTKTDRAVLPFWFKLPAASSFPCRTPLVAAFLGGVGVFPELAEGGRAS